MGTDDVKTINYLLKQGDRIIAVVGNCGCCEREAEPPDYEDPWNRGEADERVTAASVRERLASLKEQEELANALLAALEAKP